jgi:diguanylate cyclase (GGDEF)-like protein/PAS domain S-box-containing protein
MQLKYAENKELVGFEASRILFQNTQKSFIAAIFVAIIVLFSTERYVSTSAAIKWVSILLLAYFARAIVAYFFNEDTQQQKNAKNWLNALRLTCIGCGVAWGLAAHFIMPVHNAELQAFLVLAMAGVCAGALINLSLDTISASLFTTSLWITASPVFFANDNKSTAAIFTLLAAFIIVVGLASKQLARGLKDSIHLRFIAETRESELAHLTKRQSLHLQNTPMGVVEWDEDLNVVTWNKACINIFGYTAAEAIGKHISFFMPNLINMQAQQVIGRLEYENNKLIQLLNKKNELIYCEFSNTVLRNMQGQFVGMASLVQNKTEFITAQEKIHQLAYFDVLTNLPNRGLLLDRINQTLATSKRSNSYSMLAFIDLDHFKAINDIKGHDAGDYLLKTIATRLQKNMRAQDTAARLGGDEFVLVLSDIGNNKQQAQAYSEKIIKKIAQAINAPVQFDDYQHQCSASIGLCLFNDDNLDATELLRRADVAMYLSKKQGRNAYQFYDEAKLPDYEYQLKLKHDLNHALANNQLELYLQGQYNRNSEVTGAEVLLRWQHPTLGMIMPNDFIPLAEETGAIVPIGAWVLEQACSLLEKWQDDETSSRLMISVNVSAVQFNHAGFIQQVEHAIQQSACDATKLCIELTESAVMSNIEEAISTMHQIKTMGVSLAIDDFGTGYSSLSALKNLPLNELKIDRSFVKDFTKNPIDLTIVQTILQMGKNLNLRIVAEGVETEGQMAYLSNYGCNIFQGYFFAKPCNIHQFEQDLAGLVTNKTANNGPKIYDVTKPGPIKPARTKTVQAKDAQPKSAQPKSVTSKSAHTKLVQTKTGKHPEKILLNNAEQAELKEWSMQSRFMLQDKLKNTFNISTIDVVQHKFFS